MQSLRSSCNSSWIRYGSEVTDLSPATPISTDKSLCRIFKDLHILECYRTTLLQCPPNLYSTNSFILRNRDKTPSDQHEPADFDILEEVRSLVTPSNSLMSLAESSDTAYTLAAILVLAWHAVPARSGRGQLDYQWDKRFFEIGLGRWYQASLPSMHESTAMLFHVGFIVLHTNMANIHGAVREFSISNSCLPGPSSPVSRWRQSDNCEIAVLHARRVIDCGTQVTSRSGFKQPTQSTENTQQPDQARGDEAPHVAICFYLAVITLWVAEVANTPADFHAAKAVLDNGARVLQRLNLSIAHDFGKIIRRLEEKCQQQINVRIDAIG